MYLKTFHKISLYLNVQANSLIQLTGTNSEDSSEPEFKIGYHQQAISNEVDALARLSETHAAQGCGGIIGKVINDPGGFTVGCQQMACSGRLPQWVTYSNKTDSLAKDLAGVSCSRNRKKFSELYMQNSRVVQQQNGLDTIIKQSLWYTLW